MKPLELWAGAECTVARIRGRYRDQLEAAGHAARVDDLDRLADLGVRALRLPILWERTAPDGPDKADWSWADARLGRLRDLGVSPIVRLVRHGSRPPASDLLDPGFVEGLASYAEAFARRYPWVEDCTPVNEPLTTARSSALYGHWYPHARSSRAFLRALANECSATAAAMCAVRSVNPRARLVQTEDTGTVFSTPALTYQADYENVRRWASLDLPCGHIDGGHPLRRHFEALGLDPHELDRFCDEPSPPDVIGINYYVTSDRFLDEPLDRCPPHTHGGNGRHAYADVEAVRVRGEGIAGHGALLNLVSERYQRPLAVTEMHLGCARAEQARWLTEARRGVEAARRDGVDVRAVTARAAFGAVDWDSLLVLERGQYETGLFDVRGPEPWPTALARVARQLAAGVVPDDPALATPGWWRRDGRLTYPAVARVTRAAERPARPIALTSPDSPLSRALAGAYHERGLPVVWIDGRDAELSNRDALGRALARHRVWAAGDASAAHLLARGTPAAGERCGCGVFTARGPQADHAAGRRGELEPQGPLTPVALACAALDLQLVRFSPATLDGGLKEGGYVETEVPSAVPWSGRVADERATKAPRPALLVRTGPLFGGEFDDGPVARALFELTGVGPNAPGLSTVSPAYVPDVVQAVLDLPTDGETGVRHLVHEGAFDRVAMARKVAELASAQVGAHMACTAPGRGGHYGVALATERGTLLGAFGPALERHRATFDASRGDRVRVA